MPRGGYGVDAADGSGNSGAEAPAGIVRPDSDDRSTVFRPLRSYRLCHPGVNTIAPETLISRLEWRYATKRFDPDRKIPDATWRTLEDALVLAPSSFGLQPLKFVVVTGPALKAKLRPACWDQPQLPECSHGVYLLWSRT